MHGSSLGGSFWLCRGSEVYGRSSFGKYGWLSWNQLTFNPIGNETRQRCFLCPFTVSLTLNSSLNLCRMKTQISPHKYRNMTTSARSHTSKTSEGQASVGLCLFQWHCQHRVCTTLDYQSADKPYTAAAAHTHEFFPLSAEALCDISVQNNYLSVIWRCRGKRSRTSSERKLAD